MPEGQFRNDPVVSLVGYVGSNPELRGYGQATPQAQLLKFRFSVTTAYGGENNSLWYDVAIFDEVLIASAKEKVYKGAVIGLEGFFTTRVGDNGQTWLNIKALKVWLLTPLKRTEKGARAAAPVAAPAAPQLSPDQLAAFEAWKKAQAAPAAAPAAAPGGVAIPDTLPW